METDHRARGLSPMRGFDPEYPDLPAWIIGITDRIWEGRGVALIDRWYAPDCPVHTSMGPAVGAKGAITATLQTLAAFPDRRLLPEDIVWSGDDEAGFLSSHRIVSPARHLGPGVFGPPTGRAVQFRSVADCFCVGGIITEEWLARDQAGMCVQIGLEPEALARTLAAADPAPWHLDSARRLRSEGALRPPVLQDHPAARLVRDTIAAVWTGKDLAAVRQAYHPACAVHLPRGQLVYGHERLTGFLFNWLAALPDAAAFVEHSIVLDEPGQAVRVATRWWIVGTHTADGVFGPASGAVVLALVISHAHVVDGRIREEWMVTDEVAVLKQIAQQRG